PGAFTKLQLLVPGESPAAGASTGKTGSPNSRTAGAGFTVTVNAVDANWNTVSTNHTVGITATDPNAVLPANNALTSGSTTLALTNKTAGTWTITATDITDGTKTSNTSPAITVTAAAFTKLQILVPGEAASPGSASGKSGSPNAQAVGVAFNATVNAVDANWNFITNASDNIAITSSDPNATMPSNAALVSGTQNFIIT